MMAELTFLEQDQVLWILIVGFLLTFLFSFSIGANNVANAFGTAVGSKVLSQLQAIILAAIFMTLGGVIVGPAVANTIENGIVDIDLYDSDPELLMLGQISVILACTAWTMIATTFKLPIAVTHSIVGAVVGFHVMATGTGGINWDSLILIVVSWVASPVLSGSLALVLYFIMLYSLVKKENPLESGVKTLPAWYGTVVFINVLSVLIQLQSLFEEYEMSLYASIFISVGCALLAAVLVWFFLVPRLKKESEIENEALLRKEEKTLPREDGTHGNVPNHVNEAALKDTPAPESGSSDMALKSKSPKSDLTETDNARDNPEVARLCSPLLVLSVIFTAFAYGSLLVSIGVAPLSTIWNVYESTKVTKTISNPFWLFLYGSAALILGFGVIGGRVTKTVGEGITSLSPSSSFPIELGSTTVILVASNLGIPVSSTQCKIGAIAIVGYFSDGGVNLKLLGNIILAWVITLPVTAAISAGFTALLQLTDSYNINIPGSMDPSRVPVTL